MAVLNWKHHTLIQSLMMRGPLCEADFLKVFSGVTGINPRTIHSSSFSNYFCFLPVISQFRENSIYLRFDFRAKIGPLTYTGLLGWFDSASLWNCFFELRCSVNDNIGSRGSSDREFNDALLNINKELSYIQMELRCCRNQNDGKVCYGLVNNVSDEQSKLGTKYSVPQTAFFKSIIEAIISDTTAQGSICTFDALNLRLEVQVNCGAESQSQLQSQSQFGSQVHPALRNFSLSQKEKTLDELVQEKWLCRSPDAKIGLGERSFLELRSVFHNSGNPICEVCNEAAIKAYMCKNEECTVRIHHYCLTKKFSGSMGNIACPTCGIQWDCQLDQSEPVEANNVQYELTETGSKRKRRKALRVADSAGPSQASLSVSDLRRTTRLSS